MGSVWEALSPLPASFPISVLAGGSTSQESLAIPLGSSGHGARLAQTHERRRLLWHRFSGAITPTGMPSSLFWPKDLAELGPLGEVRVPLSPLLSSRYLQHHSPTLTTHLSPTLPHHLVMPGTRRGRMQSLQRQEGSPWSSSWPLRPCCCFLANCQPSQTTGKAGSLPVYSWSSPLRDTGTVRAGLGCCSWLQDCSKPWIWHSRVALHI